MYLEVSNITKIIRNEIILDDISLSLERGKIYGLQGKNGSGKTMLMRAICGLLRPTKGNVTIDGKRLGDKMDFLPSVGALIENPGFIGQFTGYENLKMLADIKGLIGKTDIQDILERIGLENAEKKKYKAYSLGMKQKLGIAAAIMERPDVIILDEPTNALDEESMKNLHCILTEYKDHGSLILISCHDKEELEMLSDEIYEIENGKIKNHRRIQDGKAI
ncbi:MAG: ABC transporter ATP-binding protein [Anaerostipes sp.]|nr:ABC transporter ATP-binding protein [Anaerostipes sp.]